MISLKNKRLHKFILLACTCLFLSGCGKSSTELETYKTNMNSFFESVSSYNDQINAIDASSDDATSQLLTYLDEMNLAFQTMAGYEVPDEFSAATSLADDAADYMNQAVTLYHQAYDGEYNADSEAQALADYQKANTRVQYLISILHGETPSGEGVSVVTKDAGTIATVPSDTGTSAAASSQISQ